METNFCQLKKRVKKRALQIFVISSKGFLAICHAFAPCGILTICLQNNEIGCIIEIRAEELRQI